jgi:hypothetical protein
VDLIVAGVSKATKVFVLSGAAMDVIKEFAQSLAGRKPSTARLYVAGARAAIKAAGADVSECGSRAELLTLLRKSPPIKGAARVAPFLRFLEGGGAASDRRAKESLSTEDIRGIQNRVVQTLAKRMRSDKNPSIATRRDMALIASLCCAPAQLQQERTNSLKWPQSCLQIRVAKCFYGARKSRNRLSHFLCVTGRSGEKGLLGPTRLGSTEKGLNGGSQSSFSPDPAAEPWGERPCTTP